MGVMAYTISSSVRLSFGSYQLWLRKYARSSSSEKIRLVSDGLSRVWNRNDLSDDDPDRIVTTNTQKPGSEDVTVGLAAAFHYGRYGTTHVTNKKSQYYEMLLDENGVPYEWFKKGYYYSMPYGWDWNYYWSLIAQ